jgi:HTH-type transcriptional regulator/antitoxin HigA
MSEKNNSSYACTPGRFITRELEVRGWSQHDLSIILGYPETMVHDLVQDRIQISADLARQLSFAFGSSTEFWLNLEAQVKHMDCG